MKLWYEPVTSHGYIAHQSRMLGVVTVTGSCVATYTTILCQAVHLVVGPIVLYCCWWQDLSEPTVTVFLS